MSSHRELHDLRPGSWFHWWWPHTKSIAAKQNFLKQIKTSPYSQPTSSFLYVCSCAAFSCLLQIALLSHDKRWSVIEITDMCCLGVLHSQKQLLPPPSPFFPLLNCFVIGPNIQISLLNSTLTFFFFQINNFPIFLPTLSLNLILEGESKCS